MKGLLDGDIVVFRCGFAAERTVWHLAWGPDVEVAPDGTRDERRGWNHVKTFTRKSDAEDALDDMLPGTYSRVQGEDYDLWPEKVLEPLEYALQNVKTLINRICDTLSLDPQFDLEVFFSSSKNFRHEIAKTRPYKGNRKVEHRPTHEKAIRNYLMEQYDSYMGVNEEADDLMGIRATELGPEQSIIITLDKDLDCIPGLHYNWVHDVKYTIGEREAMHNFHLQLMTGDSTDNIPGLPGIGKGRGERALHGCDTPEQELEEVFRQYQIHSGKNDWQEYLLEQGRLLWIRRQPGELWTVEFPEDQGWEQQELQLEVD